MKLKRILLAVAIVFFLGVFIFSGYKIYKSMTEYSEAEEYYSDFAERFVSPVLPDAGLSGSVTYDTAASSGETGNEAGDETSGASGAPSTNVPPQTEAQSGPLKVDFDSLLEYNGDVVGWLYCPNTVMNYPVAQSDDNSYYLRRSLNHSYLVTGTIFADYRCVAPGEDRNYIIYGHDMRNGTIFGMLEKYESSSYMSAHPCFYYFTPDGDYRVDVYAGFTVDAHDKLYNIGGSNAKYIAHVKELAKSGTVSAEVDITEDDKLIILSTCSDAFENARYVLVGKVSAEK